MDAPSTIELRDYVAGRLGAERFAAVDAWLASQPESEVERLLNAVSDDQAGLLAEVSRTVPQEGFIADAGPGRLRVDAALGAGGMAAVSAARDRQLDRTVALKTLKPRQPGETLEQYHLREAAFRHEAAITAGLEHPAIVPIYDLGRHDGQLAFTMKRVSGETLQRVVENGNRAQGELVAGVLRVAEAIAYAHSRGVVHRDLTPANILLSEYGAIYVLDWGVAALVGEGAGLAVGTPGWSAPEQTQGIAADPRMDVYALGGLLQFVLTGQVPDQHPHPHGPKALIAVINRCRAQDPAARYADADQVADELRRWLEDGVTVAQQAGLLALGWIRFKRSRQLQITLATALLLIGGITGYWYWTVVQERRLAEERIQQLESSVSIEQPDALRIALDEVRRIAQDHPDVVAATSLLTRWQTALELADNQAALAALRERISALLARWRRSGPWSDEIADWQAVLATAGLTRDASVADITTTLNAHPLRSLLIQGYVHIWLAAVNTHNHDLADQIADIVAASGPTAGWRALGRLLKRTEFQAHQPVFCQCSESDEAMTDPDSAAAVLAIYGPDKRLINYAREQLQKDPGAFWPLMASAQAALDTGELATAERQALTAAGAEPGSMYPQMILAYVALARGDHDRLRDAVERAYAANPEHSEVLVLKAVVLAQSGDHDAAQAIVAQLDARHLQYHRQHRVGHRMERGVDALIANGLTIPDADPQLGPLVPHDH